MGQTERMIHVKQSKKGSWRLSEQRKHPYVVSTDESYVFLPILKNAHSYTSMFFEQGLGWIRCDPNNVTITEKTKIILLRDPIERWISGATEYLHLHHRDFDFNNDDLLMLLFDIIIVDEHTKPQVTFIEGIDLSNALFFNVDDKLTTNLSKWVRKKFNPFFNAPTNLWRNSKIENSTKKLINNRLSDFVNRYKERFEYCYEEDYNLINSINFYKGGI